MIHKMEVSNFGSFKSARLNLKKQGLVWINGQNNDSEGATSNGAGKTTIFKALTWGLYGESIDGEKGDGVIRYGEKEAQVSIDIEPSWTVFRTRKKGTTHLSLTHKDEPVVGNKKDLQTKINNIVGLDFKAFRNTVLYGQNDSARFADPNVKDTERKDMLHRILRTSILKGCHKLALEKAKIKKYEAIEVESQYSMAKMAVIEHSDALEDVSVKMTAWETDRNKKVHGIIEEIQELKEQAKAIISDTPDIEKLQAQETRYKKAIENSERAQVKLDKAKKQAHAMELEAERQLSNARVTKEKLEDTLKKLERLRGEKCPLCTGSLESGAANEYKESLKKEKSEYLKQYKELKTAHKGFMEIAKAGIEKVKKESIASARLPSLRLKLEDIQTRIHETETTTEKAKEIIKRARLHHDKLKEVKSEMNPHREYFEQLKETDKKKKKLVEELRTKHDEIKKAHEVCQFWVRGYSGQGLPSYVLDGVMKQITDRANYYLGILSDGDITMEFSTQRELKSSKGEFKDEIDIRWVVEGIAGYPPSGGQQRKMEIATDLSLMDLAETYEGSALNLFIADEILDGLDSEGTDRVLRLLKELRSRRESIFVISHQSGMSEIFERSFCVKKNEGISVLVGPA